MDNVDTKGSWQTIRVGQDLLVFPLRGEGASLRFRLVKGRYVRTG